MAIGVGGLPGRDPVTNSVSAEACDANAYVPVNVPNGDGNVTVIASPVSV
jgi:hypothetical protein